MDNIPLGQWSGSDAIDRLRETIGALNKQSEKQNRTMVRLTWAILVLTIVMAVVGTVQTLIAFR